VGPRGNCFKGPYMAIKSLGSHFWGLIKTGKLSNLWGLKGIIRAGSLLGKFGGRDTGKGGKPLLEEMC